MEVRPDATPEAAPPPVGPPCRHLRFKGMYVYTDVSASTEPGDHDNTIFWCQKTLKDVGPDQGFVGREDCRETWRSCYETD
ncbi:hypothetical protein [Planctomyces sp. SH-PL62]|uniref:hypothetical protein n=1 Tax=Planctomyces sp. SH-PL62 TaxID=1636152 RepID=UPI00078EABC7|nr:hypothetical protein [Planctomyces sp. SH-PL62]AMV38800.1 hypothetical protein VT85_15295 [Planctomyces sp. SH-PL62]